jgi:hypothetical protein
MLRRPINQNWSKYGGKNDRKRHMHIQEALEQEIHG